ncbi:MAG: BTAD domain-containing putative transcriptional regulator [Labedaea sp.]
MEFSVLGPVRCWHGGRPVALGGRQRRCVLAVLLLRAGQVVPLDRMVELVWGEQPPVAWRNAVQTHVSRLRKALAADPAVRIEADPPGYVLHVDPTRVDLLRFRASVARARRTDDPGRASELLREALTQWQGPALADVVANDSLRRLSTSLDEERLAALQQRLAMDLRLGRHVTVLGELSDLAGAHPTHEGVAELWVLALYRCGRQAEALAALQRIRTRMVDELGIEPGPALRALRQRILRADAGLDPATEALDPGPAVPAQLPADVPGFCGRTGELAELDRVLAGSRRDRTHPVVVALSGTAGVGKTALAVHWAHRVRPAFPDGQLYVDLKGYDPSQPMGTGDALARLLGALGVRDKDIPTQVEARVTRYRTAVADRRLLMVLDNASSVEQLRALLPGTDSCAVVVTSRDSLGGLVALNGAHRLELDVLPMDDATSLLCNLIGARAGADPASTGLLARQCARLPLALRVAAELAVSRAGTPLARLVHELRDSQRRLRLLDGGSDIRATVRTVFSWSYRHLPADAARLFRVLSCHPGADFELRSAAALGRLDLDETVRLLDVLVRAHVIQPGPDDRYGMHDLFRAYAQDRAAATDSEADLAAARTRLFDHYLAVATAARDLLYPATSPEKRVVTALSPTNDPEWLRAWLDAERPNLVTVCGYAAGHGWPEHAVALAATLYRYLEGGHYGDALVIHTAALDAAKRVGDRCGEAHALTNLGLVHRLLGQYGPATEHLTNALELHRRTGDRDGEARTLSNLGIIEDRLGRGRAEAYLDRALSAYRELGNRHGVAAVLTNLGGLHNGLGRHSCAAGHLTEALGLFRELGDRGGAASALTNLGAAETETGQYPRAAGHLEEALALFQELGHRYGQAIALSNLGRVYDELGHHDRALDHLGRALAILRETGHRYGEASVLNGLGSALHAAGRPGALERHTAALEIATETGDRDEQTRARAGIDRVRLGTGERCPTVS